MTEPYICVLVDDCAPHDEECGFWHGGGCDCNPARLLARETIHCAECDYVNDYTGTALCNCHARCLFPDEQCQHISGEHCPLNAHEPMVP